MKAVILAGGLGTRIGEETQLKPKPMVEIGDKPVIWHIMKILSSYGINDFIICLGYKGYIIKEYFANYILHMSDVTIDMVENKVEFHQNSAEPWRVTLVDTGEQSMTGGRLKRIQPYVQDETFFMTYGDGVANVDIDSLIKFHKEHKKAATVTAVLPPGRFGALDIDTLGKIKSFREKPAGDDSFINGGFFVLEPSIFDYIDDDLSVWEQNPLEMLAKDSQLMAFKHTGFWQPMDTLRDKKHLEELWKSGGAPWKVWG